MSAITSTTISRSTEVIQQLMYEEMARERERVRADQARRAYLRQLAVVRRRQRRADSARRVLQSLSVL
jgi:hypothetical protein